MLTIRRCQNQVLATECTRRFVVEITKELSTLDTTPKNKRGIDYAESFVRAAIEEWQIEGEVSMQTMRTYLLNMYKHEGTPVVNWKNTIKNMREFEAEDRLTLVVDRLLCLNHANQHI